ncbi:MAG: sugar phosphate isomerase/epimerase [Actinobacteria bacterium]|nr:sugar phosphate isomerase/epimerase [Actinomycetota bacterium]
MTSRLACADSAFPRLSHDVALAVIADLGIDAVDVCIWAGYDHNPPEVALADPARSAEEIGARLERHGLHPADVYLILAESFEDRAVNHPDEAVRDDAYRQFEATLDLAVRLGSPGVTILPGAVFPGIDEGESLDLAARELQRRAEQAGEAGLRFTVEPHFRSIVPTPMRTAVLLERTEDVGLALDPSHFAFQGYELEDCFPLLSRTQHVHLRQGGPGLVQARTHEGTIDYALLRDRLLDGGYEGYFTLEYQWEEGWLDFTRVDCIGETADMRDLMLEPRR